MKIFVAGATGVIGRPLLAQLLAQGHDVVARTRSPWFAPDGDVAQQVRQQQFPIVGSEAAAHHNSITRLCLVTRGNAQLVVSVNA